MTRQVAGCGPRLAGSLVTLAVAVSWPQSVDSGETHGSINVSVIVVDSCEVVADAEQSEIDQICADLADLGQVTVTPAGEADPPSDAADAVDEVARQNGADIQLVTISY